MRDLFYTILVVWVLWRIFNSLSAYKSKQSANAQARYNTKQGETKIEYVPPQKKKMPDTEGEYVEYEEVK
ncbi:MAG: hypothetical protein WBM13_01275 [Bacteroidia bacterium]